MPKERKSPAFAGLASIDRAYNHCAAGENDLVLLSLLDYHTKSPSPCQGGIFIISLAVTGNYVIDDPIIESRGYVFAGNRDADKEIKSVVHKAVEQYDYESGNKDELASAVKKALKNYIFKKTKQSPLIVVSVLEV